MFWRIQAEVQNPVCGIGLVQLFEPLALYEISTEVN